MKRFIWQHAVLCTTLVLSTSFALHAQNATTGGDQLAQPDAQGSQPGAGRQGGGGQGGRRGGGVRGTVTAVSGSTISVKNEQGEAWTIVTTDNTRVRVDGQPGAFSAVKPGDEAAAIGMPDADKHEVHAMMVMDVSAAMVAKAKANMGKTYITGRITAINADDAKLTIMRTDKVSQVISLDESTSLHKGGRMDPAAMQAAGLDMGMGAMGGGGMGGGRRGGQGGGQGAGAPPARDEAGEAITLADVKVGDSVIGLGSVKGSSFVPTDLRVQERPAGGGMGGGRRGGQGGDAPPPQ
jgi:hypothetical protein